MTAPKPSAALQPALMPPDRASGGDSNGVYKALRIPYRYVILISGGGALESVEGYKAMALAERGSYDPTPDERQERILAYARGASHFDVMRMFKISYQAAKQFKKRNLPEIEAKAKLLDGAITDRTSELWVTDQVAQYELRQHLAEAILERINSGDLDDKDVSRFTRDIDQLLYKSAELAGLITQRTAAKVETDGTITYEIPGVDLNEVMNGWKQAGSAVELAADVVPDLEPEPVPEPAPMPERFMGKAAREPAEPQEPVRKPVHR